MKKILFMLAAVFCCTLMATSLISCGDDDDTPAGPYNYSVGFSKISGSSDETKQIYATYKEALGVESTSKFTANSDAVVVAGCKKAEEKLNQMSFKGSYTVQTTNETTLKVVHTWSNK